MKTTDIFTAQSIAANYTNAASNITPYLGTGLFTPEKKAGLDLKWIKGHNGLPVSLAPSVFDAKSTFRDRVGVSVNETQMAFFKESMLIKEADEQELMRVTDANDPYAQQVLTNIFNDAKNLIDGADVVAERMRMQLLAPMGGNVGIDIQANGVDYTYNYDPNGEWKAKHYLKIATAADKWDAADTCDPVRDIEAALDAQEQESGERPSVLLMSRGTFNLIKNSKKVQSGVLAQNVTANVNYTSTKIKDYIQEELSVTVVIYNKQYRDETGIAKKFYPDGGVMLLPTGPIGSTWYGTTPEERTLTGITGANVAIVNTGVAVTVTTTSDPVNTKTTVSEILLPSFERMNDCYFLEVK